MLDVHFNLWVDTVDEKWVPGRGEADPVPRGTWMPLCDTLSSQAPRRSSNAEEVTCKKCKVKLVDARLTK